MLLLDDWFASFCENVKRFLLGDVAADGFCAAGGDGPRRLNTDDGFDAVELLVFVLKENPPALLC